VRRPGRSLADPALEAVDFFGRQSVAVRRHADRGVGVGDAANQFAFAGLTCHERRAPRLGGLHGRTTGKRAQAAFPLHAPWRAAQVSWRRGRLSASKSTAATGCVLRRSQANPSVKGTAEASRGGHRTFENPPGELARTPNSEEIFSSEYQA
jgi:hypothetical protein